MKKSLSLLRGLGVVMLMELLVLAQVQQATVAQVPTAPPQPALRLDIPHSDNPIDAYRATLVPQPNLANSPRIDALVNNGVLELQLEGCDCAGAGEQSRYGDRAIQHSDCSGRHPAYAGRRIVPRRQYGRGAEYAGRRRGWLWFELGRRGAGGTSGGAGGAGSGASGLVPSTLGTGTNVSSYDPTIQARSTSSTSLSRSRTSSIYGVPTLQQNTTNGNIGYIAGVSDRNYVFCGLRKQPRRHRTARTAF